MILFGPSGCGKTSLKKRIIELDPRFMRFITHTTRSPRPNELTGVDYHFVSQQHFSSLVDEGKLIEHMVYNNAHYGSAKQELELITSLGKVPILDIDYRGVKCFRDFLGKDGVWCVYVLVPDDTTLRARLLSRKSESVQSLESRMRISKAEIALIEAERIYDISVVNDDFDRAASSILSLSSNIYSDQSAE